MRLLTWNIHKGIGGTDRTYRIERTLAVIEQADPDIVLLQEVDSGVPRSHHHDQPEAMLERLAYATGLFQRNVDVKGGGYGNMILARWAIPWHANVDLRWQWKKPRAAQVARVATPAGDLLVVNQHLGLAEFERQWQIARLLQDGGLGAHASLPTIVAGDMNDWRNQLASRQFLPAGFDHVTEPPSQFRSFPAAMPMGSLDKAFVRGAIEVQQAQVLRTPLTREASDHLPLIIDFTLADRAA